VLRTSFDHTKEDALTVEFADLETPRAVLDHLDGLTFPDLDLRVLVAIRDPLSAQSE
jgi:hypothetical protein